MSHVPDFATDPIGCLNYIFVERVLGQRLAAGQSPAQRPVFLKPHGVARGRFTVRPDLPPDLRIGVFAGQSYAAVVRFSSDTQPGKPDLGTTCGVALKLFDVPGEKLLEPAATTHDFLLQNHDVFFVDTARDFAEMMTAGIVGGDFAPYFAAHPAAKEIIAAMAQPLASVAATEYWSVLPFRFGADRHVKYKLEPVAAVAALPGLDPGAQNTLHLDLKTRLRTGALEFRFLLQFRTGTMPLDRATKRWSESESAPVCVGTLVLPEQNIDAQDQAGFGENLAFNIWHALPVHAPVGSLAEARKVVYRASADARRTRNSQPTTEPDGPQLKLGAPPLVASPASIVRAAIHPSIGIARVGNSENDYYFAPEVPDPGPEPGGYRDASGALKRQAVRFRIYGYDADGRVVAELTAANASIDWCVQVANRKAAWYQFQLALDIPEAAEPATAPAARRNAAFAGAARANLVIDPGARWIHGVDTGGSNYRFDSGTICGRPVYLGELRTDAAGRLIFLGGRGVADSFDGSMIMGFANSDGWFDDTSDGPVTATVLVDGRAVPCDPAWVVTAPPNYAPELKTVRTLYDLLTQIAIENRALPPVAANHRVSFAREVLPIFRRMAELGWVNRGFAAQFGWGGPSDFLSAEWLRRLGTPPRDDGTRRIDEFADLRRQIFNAFRAAPGGSFDRPDVQGGDPRPWPWIYGDAVDVPYTASPRQNLALTDRQLAVLQLWSKGQFAGDYDPAATPHRALAAVPLADQPATLDEASLSFCLADAFHPGCEVTWPLRHWSMFMAPYRIRHRNALAPERDYGDVLTPEIALAADGPLHEQGPGSLTRWMGVPWQADTASCRSGYMRDYDPDLPTFWAARVPNDVLTEEDYTLVMDRTRPLPERIAAFHRRRKWLRDLDLHSARLNQINRMVRLFGRLGVIERRPGPGDAEFPATMFVETRREPGVAPLRDAGTAEAPVVFRSHRRSR
jgi:hypothetical protein